MIPTPNLEEIVTIRILNPESENPDKVLQYLGGKRQPQRWFGYGFLQITTQAVKELITEGYKIEITTKEEAESKIKKAEYRENWLRQRNSYYELKRKKEKNREN